MIKPLIILVMVSLLFACNGTTNEKGSNSKSTYKAQAQSKKQSPVAKDTIPDTSDKSANKSGQPSKILSNDNIYGIEQNGSFKLYTHQPFKSSKYNLYKGDPKVEILSKKGEVIKTIDIIKTQQLLPEYDSISPHPNLRNMFRIHLTDSQDVYDYVNTEYFGKVKPMPNLFYEIRYKINNGVLWIQNIAYGMDTDVYGGQTEIIGIDSTGKEICRIQLKGWMTSMMATDSNNYIVLKTGGQATERVEYWNPMTYYAIDVMNNKIIYHHYSLTDYIGGGTINSKLYMYLRKNRNAGNWKGLYKILVIDPKELLIYQLNEAALESLPKGSPGFHENYFEWHIPNQENIRLDYNKDFQIYPLNK